MTFCLRLNEIRAQSREARFTGNGFSGWISSDSRGTGSKRSDTNRFGAPVKWR